MADGLAAKLRQWREEAGLTQDDLADALGITQQTISEWERGRAAPHFKRSATVDKALRLPEGTLARALQQEAGLDRPPTPDGDEAPQIAALSGKLSRLNDRDRKYVEDLVERFLAEEP